MPSKVCSHCRHRKPLAEFNKKAAAKDGKQPTCRECNRARSRQYYRENHAKHIGAIQAQKRERRKLLKALVEAIKVANGCALCPENDPVCLEFHHVDPSEKDFNIGTHKRVDWKLAKLLKEIKKCAVVCANCHKKVHAGKRTITRRMTCEINVATATI
jgi:hypothetical protein